MQSKYNRQPKYFNSLETVYESELIKIGDYFTTRFVPFYLLLWTPSNNNANNVKTN